MPSPASNARLGRSSATRYTRVAQGVFGLLALAGAGVLVVGMKTPALPGPEDQKLEPVSATKSAELHKSTFADAPATSARFGALANAPKPVAVVQPNQPKAGPTPPPPPPTPTELLKYLGEAKFGTRAFALLSQGGKQRFVGVGQVVEGEEVVAVEPDAVTLKKNGVERRLALAERTGDRISRVRPGAPPASSGRLGVQTGAPNVPTLRSNDPLYAKQSSLARRLMNLPPEDRKIMADFREKLRGEGDFESEEHFNEKLYDMLKENVSKNTRQMLERIEKLEAEGRFDDADRVSRKMRGGEDGKGADQEPKESEGKE